MQSHTFCVTAFIPVALQSCLIALTCARQEGVQGLILDLRDNFGGAVASGYEVASSLLPQGKTFFIVVDRSGVEEIVPVLPGLQPPDLPLVSAGFLLVGSRGRGGKGAGQLRRGEGRRKGVSV